MESLNCQVTIGGINKVVEFHGVRNVYPTTGCEQINCYFTIPSQYRPEVGDFIGIYPVGWTSLIGHCLIKKYVKPENVWGTPAGQQYGKVEFDGEYLMQELQLNNGGCIEQQQQEQPKYYQFVYVRNGEYIRGVSTPFMFVPTTTIQQQLTSTVEEIPSIFRQTPFGGMLSSVQQQQQQQQQQFRQGGLTLGQVVEREMQKLQNGIFGLEQGLVGYKSVFPTIDETIISTTTGYPTTNTTTTTVVQQQQPTPVEIMCEQWCQQQQQQQPFGGELRQQPYQLRKHWQSRIGEVQQMLGEQMRLEQAQRRIEQLNMLGQLRSYERHIQHVQRKEQEINEYLRSVKMQKQIAEFEQKVYNLIKLGEQRQTTTEQPEFYVRKYEQLLREKVEIEIQKRQAIMHKLRQTVRECERKLREVQTGEQQHYQRYHQIVKQRIGQQFEAKYLQPTIFQQGQFTLNAEWELREQLRQQVGQVIQEQRRELFQLIKAQKQMQFLCQEIACKLQELECQEIYSQLRIPRIQPTTPYQQQQQYQQYQQYPQYEQHYTQVQQLEQQLFELKQTLRQKMIQQTIGLPTTTSTTAINTLVSSVEWYKPLVQKLRELEWTLRQEKMIRQQEQQQLVVELVGGQQQQQQQQWFERRIQNLTQHSRFFERQVEQLRQQQQQQFELKEVLCQLRQLEGELCEYPQFYQQFKHHQQQQQHFYQQQQQEKVVELCQYLQTIVREKLAQLTTIVGGGPLSTMRLGEQLPIVECFVQTGNHSAWKQMMQFERKLVQLKGMIVEKQQYQQLQQRLVELEQYVQQQQQQQPEFAGRWSVQRIERCQEQIRSLRQMLDQHQQQWQQQQWQQQQQLQQQLLNGCQYQQPQPQQWQHWSVVPEQFVQHQQKYERLCQLVQELECQIVEQQQWKPQYHQQQQQQQQYQMMPSTMYVNVCGGQQQQQQQQQLVGLNLIQQRFERLVQEFQQRIIFGQQQQQQRGEFLLPEHVAQKIESIVQYLRNNVEQQQQQVNKPYFGHQLREKICEFETILCEQPELVELVRQQQQVQQQGWTIQQQQQQQQVQQFVRQACKQIRELKSQIQCVLDDWVLISATEGPYGGEYVAEQCCNEINNNQQLEKDLMCFLAGEQKQQQQQTVEKQLKQQLKQQFVEELVNGGLPTVGGKWMSQPINYEQQQQQQRLAAQVERKLEQFERLFEQQQEQQQQQYESVDALFYPIGGRQQQQQQQTTGALRSLASVENLIGELETELVKLRLQKECQPTITTPYTTTTTRMVLNGQITPESVCEEITKLVGQTLLTTVVPTIVKGQQQQQQQDKQTTTTSSTIVVEPTPFGGQAVKVQQREITQQQQQQF